ncbi:MAG: phospholipase [Gammaproteobacteria bacterium]|nr:MAG: phospholipase [Gammaproteobacteria bacterium]RLA50810.1 MAG: phospholipase [Gammaproteobacteria bacterium]
MRLIFVHGWSVTHTNTYGELPASLVASASAHNLEVDITHIYLGKYISFRDEVTLDDIAIAFDTALRDLPGNANTLQPFSCITHSTGGPVVRHWVNRFYGARKLSDLPLVHLVMLAPANHGSSLAVLGKKRVGRINSWFRGIEPGQRVLDWLALGSDGQWSLNEDFLSYRSAKHNFFPFVLAGQGIDTKFYDFVNSYLVEPGSDGVVRVAGANMNFRYLSLIQSEIPIKPRGNVLKLEYNERRPVRRPTPVPIGVFSEFSHSGSKMGIMAVKSKAHSHQLIVSKILQCLSVTGANDYAQVGIDLARITESEQYKKPAGKSGKISRYSMLVFRVRDQSGNTIGYEDFDIHLLAGKTYRSDKLPTGFFIDKQLNKETSSLVYFVDADKMSELRDGCYGLRVVVRPQKGFSYYATGEFQSEGLPIDSVFAPNETTYIDITMNRNIDRNVFHFSSAKEPRESFKNTKPSRRSTSR